MGVRAIPCPPPWATVENGYQYTHKQAGRVNLDKWRYGRAGVRSVRRSGARLGARAGLRSGSGARGAERVAVSVRACACVSVGAKIGNRAGACARACDSPMCPCGALWGLVARFGALPD